MISLHYSGFTSAIKAPKFSSPQPTTKSAQSSHIYRVNPSQRPRAMAFDSLATPQNLRQIKGKSTRAEGSYFPVFVSPPSSIFAGAEDNDGLEIPFLEYPDQSLAGQFGRSPAVSIPVDAGDRSEITTPTSNSSRTASPGSVGLRSLPTTPSVEEEPPFANSNILVHLEEPRRKWPWRYWKTSQKKQKEALLVHNEVLELQRKQRDEREERISCTKLPLVEWILRGWVCEIEKQDTSNDTSPYSRIEKWNSNIPLPDVSRSVYETALNTLIERKYWDIKKSWVREPRPGATAEVSCELHEIRKQRQNRLDQKTKDDEELKQDPAVERPAWEPLMMPSPKVDCSRPAKCEVQKWRELYTVENRMIDPNRPITAEGEVDVAQGLEDGSCHTPLDSLEVGDSKNALMRALSSGGRAIPAALAPLEPSIITNIPLETTKGKLGRVRGIFGIITRRG